MIIKKVGKEFWRLEINSKEDRLVWHAPTREEVRGKYHQWIKDNKFNKVTLDTPSPVRVTKEFAHLE